MTTITHCRTCGFTDCPSLTEGGPCPRWTNAAPARVPLIPDTITEDTPSARRLGAEILGRALAHSDDMDSMIDSIVITPVHTAARTFGFTQAEAAVARRAYLSLLDG